MHIIADLQLHSRFSRAVSKEMTIPTIAAWARRKGIGLVATGDWTHPLWMREIKEHLEEVGNGLLKFKNTILETGSKKLDNEVGSSTLDKPKLPSNIQSQDLMSNLYHPLSPLFLLATEISSIYSQGGKGRRVHTLIWVPTLDSADKINKEMTRQGCNLMSDGRPIIGLSCIQVAELVLSIEPKALVIPAHAWTPWFSVFGSMSGFDSLEEAFGPYAKHIYAVETGLSSNPSMNWQINELDSRSIVSFSDAHSGPKLGREATVFDVPNGKVSYDAIFQAIRMPSLVFANNRLAPPVKARGTAREAAPHGAGSSRRQSSIAYTIEFYPEEGKYHYSGHRACNIRWGPTETKKNGTTCPVCGRPLTQGVVQRVEELAGRSQEELQITKDNVQISNSDAAVRMIASKAFPDRPPFVMLVPLQEIIAECIGSPVASPKVQIPYFKLTDALGGEFAVLLYASKEDIAKIVGERIAAGVEKVRAGDIVIDPGYDGVFGVVKLWREGETPPLVDASKEQLSMF